MLSKGQRNKKTTFLLPRADIRPNNKVALSTRVSALEAFRQYVGVFIFY
jgi:hypothetical protein